MKMNSLFFTRRISTFVAACLLLQSAGTLPTYAATLSVPDSVTESEDPLSLKNSSPDNLVLSKAVGTLPSTLIHQSRFSTDDYIYQEGIDVSVFQYDIDWEAVKADGIDFAIVRLGYRGAANPGTLNVDSKFFKNINGATEAGVDVGVYFYTQAINEEEAIEEATFVLNTLNGFELSAPVYIDIESVDSGKGRMDAARLSKDQITANLEAFCSTIVEGGYRAGIYANKSWCETRMNASVLAEKYPFWLAHYTSSTSYAGSFQCWQFSDSGSVVGISTAVDKDVFYSRKLHYTDESVTLTDRDVIIKPELLGETNIGKITYQSQDPTVAYVTQEGYIQGISNGITFVTATSSNGTSSTIMVNVMLDDSIYMNESSLSFSEAGETAQLNVLSSLGNDIDPTAIIWESTDYNVASVDDNGVVTATGSGIAVIRAVVIGAEKIDYCTTNVFVDLPLNGDCNADGIIDASDASEILTFSAAIAIRPELAEDEALVKLYDYNKDGFANAVDASNLLTDCVKAGSGIEQ